MTPTPPTDVPKGTTSEWLGDRALRGLIRLALAMPYERRVAFMGGVLKRVVGPAAGYRRRALDNLAMIHPDWDDDQRRSVADAVLDNFGRTVIESYGWREMRPRLVGTEPSGGGLPHLIEARDKGRPVIFINGHFGNYMIPLHILTMKGFVIGGIFRKMDNPYQNAHYAETFDDLSGPAFIKGRRGNMGFVRHIAGGGTAMILFDLHESSGVPIPFLGRPALTATTAADLALRYDALLVPVFGIRRPDGLTFDCILEEPIPHTNAVEMMTEATVRLERHVNAHPGQWFWIHRRWKMSGRTARSLANSP